MRGLAETLAAKPVLLTATGSAGGFFAWLIAHGEHIVLLFQIVGGFFGCLLAIASALFAGPRFLRFVSAWRRRGFRRADVE